ncbi:MAG TPA: serine/threonine protein phosphatase [Anaerolineae bacterium]|nr:serine/threonine protein phosphatase [Anaerolineae bacterium]
MSIPTRFDQVLATALTLPFTAADKFILFSDCHRGDNGWADDFARNQQLFFHALRYYYAAGFTYIELGDGEELWENRAFETIRQAHSHIYWLLHRFYAEGRFYMLVGNHNICWRALHNVRRDLDSYYNEREQKRLPLFPNITVHEGLILRYTETGDRWFLLHGHQGDLLAERCWPVARFFARRVWRYLQLIGVPDPTSPAQNSHKRRKFERAVAAWARAHELPVICGHTHRPALPKPGGALYFNAGSCVHPRCITGLEIMGGQILLVKWWLAPNLEGLLGVTREELDGPYPLTAYF